MRVGWELSASLLRGRSSGVMVLVNTAPRGSVLVEAGAVAMEKGVIL
jgi:hypothetical protein